MTSDHLHSNEHLDPAEALLFACMDQHSFHLVVSDHLASMGLGTVILAELAELADLDAITVTAPHAHIVPTPGRRPPAAALPRRLWGLIIGEAAPLPVADWLRFLAADGFWTQVGDHMVERGLVEKEQWRRLGRLGRCQTLYYPVNRILAWRPISSMHRCLNDPHAPMPSPWEALLVGVLAGLGRRRHLVLEDCAEARIDAAVNALPEPHRLLLDHLEAVVGGGSMTGRT